ncbi:hypothetical protein M501DRAFT_461779 [Patellaria atrata CBS 101060]|uniref:Uncharacterized protein n=1 Tax=Patellaria atrata CBS 101060 TaxID=1346257 RepID=A0A9P4S521_9PEZI|nr:hypothetical protein M501DRAFT_461779 [Patellaria atrata CBS 101060]
MSLSFNVNAGPLTQIGLEIVSIHTAVQLATGAYGWLKGRERSKSLIQLLSVGGGQLVSSSSFNANVYKQLRQECGTIQGVVVQERSVQSTSLPKASTAISDHAGTTCLRALTAVILCVYNIEGTVSILQDLIPYALIQHDQLDSSLEMNGPVLSSLKQYVSTIALEEDSNTFRDMMLDEARERQISLTGLPYSEIMASDDSSFLEMNICIGVLRWILTPVHRREPRQYPTRSLKVWTLAFLMGNFGFGVHASAIVVRTTEEYDEMKASPHYFGIHPNVFLVTGKGETTDEMSPADTIPHFNGSLKPQVMPIRGIPWSAFRHLRGASGKVDVHYLVDVWNYSFRTARERVKRISVERLDVQLVTQQPDTEAFEHHKALLADFSPRIHRLCAPAMSQFVPATSHTAGWELDQITERIGILKGEEELQCRNSALRENCYVLIAIILGTIYGVASKALIEGQVEANEDTEIAFSPELICPGLHRLKSWARSIGSALSALSRDLWTDLMFELFLCRDNPRMSRNSTLFSNRQQNPHEQRLILGAQANGLVAISELAVKLTIEPTALALFHIKRGQILTLPLTEDGYIEAATNLEPPLSMAMDPEPENDYLGRFDHFDPDSLRLDIEPCWESDPRTVVFRARLMGLILAPININLVVDALAYGGQSCGCTKAVERVEVPLVQRWQHIHIGQLMRTMFRGISHRRVDFDQGGFNVLIDASCAEAVTIYAIGITSCRQTTIVTECMHCSYQNVMRNTGHKGDAVMIIPWNLSA